MMKDRLYELFDNQIDLYRRIDTLKSMGYDEQDMYIITYDEDEVSMLKGFTDIMIKEDEHSTFERFKSFLKGEDSVIDVFNKMGLESDKIDYYRDEIENEKIMLLVDQNYKSTLELGEDGVFRQIEDVDKPIVEIDTPDVSTTIESDVEISTSEDITTNIKSDIGINVEDAPPDLSKLEGEILNENTK